MNLLALPRAAALALALQALCAAAQIAAPPPTMQPIPPIGAAPYPGTLTLQVDATDLDHKIFRVKESVPVQPGPLTLPRRRRTRSVA